MFETNNQQSNQDKQLSGNKGPVEDILADTDTNTKTGIENLLKDAVPFEEENKETEQASLKNAPVVPSMQKRVVPDQLKPKIENNQQPNIVSAPEIPIQSKGFAKNKLFLIIIIVLIIAVLGLASVFAYQYFSKDKVSDLQNQDSEESLQKLLEVLDEKETEPIEEEIYEYEEFEEDFNEDLEQDSDGDGLTDNIENELGTDSQKFDTDEDGLNDFEEIQIYFSDPNNPDTDEDGYLDGEEVQNGFSPLKGDGAKL